MRRRWTGAAYQDPPSAKSTPKPDAYHLLTASAKQAHAHGVMRERGVRCPYCECETVVADLLAHVEQRCPGPREPHHAARWLTHHEARVLVPRATLHRLVLNGIVRTRGETKHTEYLARDLVLALAWKQRLAQTSTARVPPPGVAQVLRHAAPGAVVEHRAKSLAVTS